MTPRRRRIWPGLPHPLGATWDGSGTNFALFSANAEKVELCLFDDRGRRELERIPLPEYTNEIWHGYLPDVHAGQLYGYRVYGPYDPDAGHRFNPHKLLIDPYARDIRGPIVWDDALFAYVIGRDPDRTFDTRDSARFMPKCRVVDSAPTRSEVPPPRTPWHDTVIYEMHVRGFTIQHPNVEDGARGTFEGLCAPATLDYLRALGVTAVELMPVHAFVNDRHLVERGLRNYWGYNPLSFFALHPDYLRRGDINEFRTFVQIMHDAGIEVILDVVYNHTAEGNHLGPTLSLRGIDNKSYYLLMPDDARHYNDVTGTGNSLELSHPQVLRMVADSLRYWVEEMKVDGFRFDLATTLARVNGHYREDASFLDVIGQDPLLVGVKLIAEPWDTGNEGYQLGRFPPGWAEWNDRYRDTVRRFWMGDGGQLPELASRLSGSSDIFNRRGRHPWASINFVTAHDGFTLCDLVSYNEKHNEDNLEGNRDGTSNNHSWNCGAEGPTNDAEIRALRYRQIRNFIATLLLSQGVPMLLAGDELARTQRGNNNAYCQDNETTWMDWRPDEDAKRLLEFTRRMIALRRRHIVFHRHRFFRGDLIFGTHLKEITWLRPDGAEMTEADWRMQSAKCIGYLISGEVGRYHVTAKGERETDDTFLVLMNASEAATKFALPERRSASHRGIVLDTARVDIFPEEENEAPSPYPLNPRSLVLIRYR